MFKEMLKRIFPRIFLKRAFVIYNILKLKTWDKLFFREQKFSQSEFTNRETKNPFLEISIDVSKFDNEVKGKLMMWCNPLWVQDQYLLHYNDSGFLDPKTGWGITMEKKLIYPSLGFSSAPHVHKPDLFETYFRKKVLTELDKIISFRDTGEENYFHFFNDVLAKLFFLIDNGINLNEYTLVIGGKLHIKNYFQYYLNNSKLSKLNWYVQQDDEWINFKKAIFCKPFTHTKKYLDRAVDLVASDEDPDGDRRIFLTRSEKSLRFIENFDEIKVILDKYRFDVVDTSELSFLQQVVLFRNCRYLIAIHGAGITNIIFRRNLLTMLEIVHPLSYVPFHYIMLANIYDFPYGVMIGQPGKKWGIGGFRVDPRQLEQRIRTMLSNAQ